MLSFLYVYSHHSILECYNLFSGVELSMRSFFVISIEFSDWVHVKEKTLYTAVDFQGWLKMTLKIKMAYISIFRSGFRKIL